MSSYFVKPRPSMRTTIHVLGKRLSGCSNALTYSNLHYHLVVVLARNRKTLTAYLEFAILSVKRGPVVEMMAPKVWKSLSIGASLKGRWGRRSCKRSTFLAGSFNASFSLSGTKHTPQLCDCNHNQRRAPTTTTNTNTVQAQVQAPSFIQLVLVSCDLCDPVKNESAPVRRLFAPRLSRIYHKYHPIRPLDMSAIQPQGRLPRVGARRRYGGRLGH